MWCDAMWYDNMWCNRNMYDMIRKHIWYDLYDIVLTDLIWHGVI